MNTKTVTVWLSKVKLHRSGTFMVAVVVVIKMMNV
jgi:hypothetical protein